MSDDYQVPSVAAARWTRVLGVVVLIAVAAYGVIMSVERLGTRASSARGAIVAKRHVPAHQTYVTQIINGRSMVTPRAVPEAYVVDVAFGDERASGAVPQELYARLAVGDSVRVEVRRGRVSGSAEIVSVSP